MANNGKRNLTDYDLTDVPEWELAKIRKAVAKRQRRWHREHVKKEKDDVR